MRHSLRNRSRSLSRLGRRVLPALALWLWAAGVQAAPGDVLFSDDFESGSLAPNWSAAGSGDAGVGGQTANSGSLSMFTRWNAVTVTSVPINLAVAGAELRFWVRRGDDAFSEDPDAVEGLVVEYLDNTASWVTLETFIGADTPGETFDRTYELPTAALHGAFQLRFRQLGGSGSDWDYWHIDDVIITETEAATSSTQGGFCEDFESGLARWSISGPGGAGTSAQTANSPSHALFLRWDDVNVTSRQVDLQGPSATVSIWVRRGDDSFSEDPDGNEDLVLEYLNSSSTWVALETFSGNGSPGGVFDREYTLPADARHAGFRLRLRYANADGPDFDYWHVDDVCIQNNAVAEYQFEQCNPLTTVEDTSVNAYDGTANGNILTTIGSPALPGDPGTCRYGIFDGSGDFVSVPNQGGAMQPQEALSFAAWVRWDGTGPSEQYIIANGHADRALGVTGPGHAQGAGLGWFRLPFSGSPVTLYSSTNLNDGAWHHLAGTFDGQSMTLYVDGAPEDSQNVAGGGAPTSVRVSYWVRRGADSFSEDPDGGENLRVQYLDNGGGWNTIDNFPGNGPPGQVLGRTNFVLPADALHSGLRVRFIQQNGSGSDWDYWHVDDVSIEGDLPLLGWQSYFSDDFEDGSLAGDWSITGNGDAGVGTQTASSGSRSMFTRWDDVTVTSRALDLTQAPAATADQGGNDSRVGSGYGSDEFAGDIDQVRIYAQALDNAGVMTEMNTAHACAVTCEVIDHFAVVHDGSAVTCQAEPVAIEAHDAGHNLDPTYIGTISIAAFNGSVNHGDWLLVSGNPGNFAAGAPNSGTATYTFDGSEPEPGLIRLTLKNTFVETVSVNVSDGTFSETTGAAMASEDPDLAFDETGFRFIDGAFNPVVGNQIAGKDSNTNPGAQSLYLQAIRTSDQTGACEGVFADGATVDVELGSLCINPASCVAGRRVSVTNNSITTAIANPQNPDGGSSYTSVPLTFTTGSRAPIVINYPDAGEIQMRARYDIPLEDGTPSGNLMQGNSNTFDVRPFGFDFTNIRQGATVNPGGLADGTGNGFIAAEDVFEATVGAYLWNAAESDAAGNPLAGADLTDNGLTPNFAWNTTLSVSPTGAFTPAGGVRGTLGGTTGLLAGDFSGGTATVSDLTYSEVGSMTLQADAAGYLGAAGFDITGTSHEQVGRFYPDHFTLLAGSSVAPGCSGAFTYMDQPALGITFTLEARSINDNATANYDTAAGYATGTVNMLAENNNDGTDLSLRISNPGGTWGNGQWAVNSATETFVRAAAPDGAFQSLQLGVQVTGDPDNRTLANRDMDPANSGNCAATASCTGKTIGAATDVRFGRLVVDNAFGSELVDLPVPVRSEYFANATSGFVLNSNDSCTSFQGADVAFSNRTGNLGADPAILNSPIAINNGEGSILLQAPGPGNEGSVDLLVDLDAAAANLPWLGYDWLTDGNQDGVFDDSPLGTATFGIYRGQDEFIYFRERY